MNFDAFSLEAHLCYIHAFHIDEINDLSEDECRELHDDEHSLGYRGHSHPDGML